MKINPEFIDLLKEAGLGNTARQIDKGIHFGFLISMLQERPSMKEYMLDGEKSVFPYEEFQVYQINFCKTNADSLQLELKVPLFEVGISQDEFGRFLELLLQYHVTGKGHQNNMLEFSIFEKDSRIDKEALQKAKQAIKDFDLNKCVIVVSNYYETTKFATKLANYLGGSSFIQDYKSYV